MPVSSATCQSRSGDGCSGLPSYRTAVAPTASADTRMFHMIQLGVVYQKNRSEASTSYCRPSCARPMTSAPAWPWTRPLGSPVVPEE